MSAATKDAETEVEQTEGQSTESTETPKKAKREFVLTPFQVRNKLNKRLKEVFGDDAPEIPGPMVYSYANSGRLGTITKSADGRQVVSEEEADKFIEAFVANRQAGGTGVRAPKSAAAPSESDELAESDAETESDEDEDSDDEGLVEAE